MIRSFEPIVDAQCRILILGTMPGVQSLIRQEYYGNRQNAFWRILFTLLGEEYTEEYAGKKALLLRNHVALWDVLKTCERAGSGDAEIENPVPNDFGEFFMKYPAIRHLYFNGGNAEKLYRKHVYRQPGIPEPGMHRLPSTSPAYTVPFSEKLGKWQSVLSGLHV